MPDQDEEAKSGSGRLDQQGRPIHTQTERFHIDAKEGRDFVRRQAGAPSERYKAVEPDLEEIRRLDSEVQSSRSVLEQNEAKKEVSDRIAKLSERTGMSEDSIIQELREERRLQGEGRTEELARVKKQFDTAVKAVVFGLTQEQITGSVVGGPTAPGRFGGSRPSTSMPLKR